MIRVFISAVILALIVGLCGYRVRKEQQLWVAVYDPLDAGLSNLEKCLNAGVSPCPGFSSSLANIEERPRFGQLNISLQTEILDLSRNEAVYEHLLAVTTQEIDRQVAMRTRSFRSPEMDRAWSVETVERLREAQRNGTTMLRELHSDRAARSIAWDLHDAGQPTIIGPGGPVWRLDDWVQYPRPLLQIEARWNDVDFLYFDEMRDEWRYRITQADLQRSNITLARICRPDLQPFDRIPRLQSIARRAGHPPTSHIVDQNSTRPLFRFPVVIMGYVPCATDRYPLVVSL